MLIRKKENKMTKKKSQKKKNGKLRIFIGSILAITIIVLNLTLLFVISWKSRTELKESSLIQYENYLESCSSMIKNKVDEYFASLNFYVNSEITKNTSTEEIWDWLKENESSRPEHFEYVGWCDALGMFYTDKNATARVADRDYWLDIMNGVKEFAVDNPSDGRISGNTVIHVAQKSKFSSSGLFAGTIEASKITEVFDDIKLGTLGIAALYGSNGEIIASNDNDKFIEELDFLYEEYPDEYDEIEAWFDSKEFQTLEIEDVNGKKIVAMYNPIHNAPWGLLFFLYESEIYKTSTNVTIFMLIGQTITVLLLIFIILQLLYYSLKPLGFVESTISEIAKGEADLTKRINIKANNEIGRVVDGYNLFAEKLQTIVKKMKSSKEELADSGVMLGNSTNDTVESISKILENIQSLNENIEQQNSAVNQTSSSVNEIASSIDSLNNMVESQSASVTQASAAVEEMIGNISAVNSNIQKMASSFSELSLKVSSGVEKQNDVNSKITEIELESKALQEANSIISGIAEQTNLLAMNAAIEAAHAGDAGKGFSVVADEIRKLSEDSSTQSQTIGNQLSKIMTTISEIVLASQTATSSFSEVSTGIEETNNLVHKISNAMEEQNSGSKEISIALDSMNKTSTDVRVASSEMAEGNKAILDEISRLQDVSNEMSYGIKSMSENADKIGNVGETLVDISDKMKNSIKTIGEQFDQFKV